jgi:E3 ubiquitin-protein ligase SHPRH
MVLFLRLDDARSKVSATLHKFRTEPTYQVLLIPYDKGANGLNLTEATHVILIEPALHVAVEAQAIARVHRIGQTKQTKVHRFVIADTVEAVIAAAHEQEQQSSSRNREALMMREIDLARRIFGIDADEEDSNNRTEDQVADGDLEVTDQSSGAHAGVASSSKDA